MGKNLIQQARGKGGPRYRAPSFNYAGKISMIRARADTVAGKVTDLIKCPGHSAPLAEVRYENGETVLLPAPERIKVGDDVNAGPAVGIETGNTLELRNIPEGTLIFNIESSPGDGGKFVRCSGTCARILSKIGNEILIELPSKKQKTFRGECRACIGTLAGSGRLEKPLIKAGAKHFAKKAKNKLYPIVCGVSMNAVDHPYGSGRGSHKGKPTTARRFAPAGANVGMLHPRRSGRKKR